MQCGPTSTDSASPPPAGDKKACERKPAGAVQSLYLEIQLQCYLHLPSGSGCIRPARGRGNQTKVGRGNPVCASIGSRIGEMRMIENVVALRPQFDVEPLGNLGGLGEGHIKI